MAQIFWTHMRSHANWAVKKCDFFFIFARNKSGPITITTTKSKRVLLGVVKPFILKKMGHTAQFWQIKSHP